MEKANDTWAAAALRFWLRRLIRQAASELQAEGVEALGAARRLRAWRV